MKSACLPDGQLPDGLECTISGWGATEECKAIKHIKTTFRGFKRENYICNATCKTDCLIQYFVIDFFFVN